MSKSQLNLIFKKKFIYLIAITILGLSCANSKTTKNKTCPNQVNGTLVNMTGLDGCGWMILLENNKKVNPINLKTFDITLKDQKKITFSYTEIKDRMDICMAGQIVEVNCITPL
ncbi:hypothetical protein DZC78_15095 [Olleya aquimaris]|uniref:Lipoprotein n=1 Tax=Olleya sediminilitoris TaxID=2795739 RepID=A0ABS1WKX0_9FLAO|nr:hypothetical protein [Olleya sediminilitoris]AXO81659.1 hypothetical protein DZC78_15095 [Olleya aquimaris]MBL7559761.1 hypothetical protein [Olleya sediminilitoris]